MATAKAYGSITIVDIGDLGTLSVHPESNQPNSVIYDPNNNGGVYNPDWGTNNLQLKPVIFYGGQELGASDVTITWKRKVGIGTEGDISSENGEEIQNGILVVKKMTINSNNPIITYICEVKYIEPNSNIELKAKGQISFSLISQPTSLKSCFITGENVFLYNGDKTIKGAEDIVLTAKLTNCSISSWEYKSSADPEVWTTISGQNGSTLTVNARSDSKYFINEMATIRVVTDVDGVNDVHTITKIYDGAAGTDTLSVSLSNEDSFIPCDKDGNVLSGGLNNVKTEIIVYNGNENITNSSKTTIAVATNGVTGEWEVPKTNDGSTTNKPIYKITGISALTGTVTFTVTYNDGSVSKPIVKTFYLTKLKAGADGTSPEILSLELSTVTLNKTADTHVYSPATFTINAFKTVGAEKSAYLGRFRIYPNESSTPLYSSGSDQSSYTYTPATGTSYSSFKVELWKAGGFNSKVDTQTVTVISDGEKGDTGASGLSFIFGNQGDVIPCSTGGTVSSTYTITIPFAAYQGTNRIACTAELPTSWPIGMSGSVTNDATISADGKITIIVSSGATLGGTTVAYDTGTIQVTLTAAGQSSKHNYTWTKNRQAASGADAVLLRAYAPNGNIINNGENDVKLSCILTEGTNTVTPDSYKWYVFDNTLDSPDYVQITSTNTYGGHSGYNDVTLTVPADAVNAYASYCVDVTYKSKSYKDYISVQDKTDPLQVEIFSTLGDKITNGVGVGCIYAKVYQDGVELDGLQNLKVSAIEPTSPLEGDVWAHIDQSTQKIILKKRTGSSWTAFTLSDMQCDYKWTFGDYDGVATNLNNQANSIAKFLYIQGSYITKKMQFNLEITKKIKK